MTDLRFLHTSDLHLGKSFGPYTDGPRLTEARHQSLVRLIQAARSNDAPHILVAGDVFDVPTPAPTTWRQAIATMAEASDITWWLMPGNHDNLREAQATWEQIAALGHPNIQTMTTTEPRTLQPGAVLLPAPLMTRHPSSDPSEALAATEGEVIRIGLAHGPITGFGEDEARPGVIAPDRDKRASLDYLALGDWHRQMKVSDRVWYSGAPEYTDFRHLGQGGCLLVSIAAPGARPDVTPIAIGAFHWAPLSVSLLPGDDPLQAITQALPQSPRRDTLVKLEISGRARLAEASQLSGLGAQIGPEFCHFDFDVTGLHLDLDTSDLDEIAPTGALRHAADALAADSTDPALSERERQVAAAALRRLHSIVAGGAA
ncbi:metallophosphoesterase family protein [Tropicibacter oceani]|uniref:DNA repair exonuclease n=1 Tax=Tropicibacter oceani TaxID=3058420 RepID=A0ABY8QKN2_9RHOB|nr:DNA repair exonuclease [Tropicibacter oceani]WGW04697.1 DNA repair exonuclease [Tropicibacter oceani]